MTNEEFRRAMEVTQAEYRTPRDLIRAVERVLGLPKIERYPLFREAPRPAPSRVETVKAERAAAAERGEVELRAAVIDALVAEGLARPVAAERTNTPAKLDAEADRLGLL